MEPTNRRTFLRHTGIAVAAAGVASAIPAGAAGALGDGHKPIPNDARAEQPVIAHVRDARKGEVVLYTGEQEVVITDKRLASILFHAAR